MLMVENRKCHIFEQGAGGPVILMGISSERSEEAEAVFAESQKLTSKPFVLFAYETDDWNEDFSPWPAAGLMENQRFGGVSTQLFVPQ